MNYRQINSCSPKIAPKAYNSLKSKGSQFLTSLLCRNQKMKILIPVLKKSNII